MKVFLIIYFIGFLLTLILSRSISKDSQGGWSNGDKKTADILVKIFIMPVIYSIIPFLIYLFFKGILW